MERYELIDEKSSKFWEIDLQGTSYSVRYGKIGAKGTSSEKEFESLEAAQSAYDKQVAGRVKKGYKAAQAEPAT